MFSWLNLLHSLIRGINLQTLTNHIIYNTSFHSSFPLMNIRSVITVCDLFLILRWRLRAVGLVANVCGHLGQTNERGDRAHQPHQPVWETSGPQEAWRHPVNGVAEVSHAADGWDHLHSHLSPDLMAEEENTSIHQDVNSNSFYFSCKQQQRHDTCCHLPPSGISSVFSSAAAELEVIYRATGFKDIID